MASFADAVAARQSSGGGSGRRSRGTRGAPPIQTPEGPMPAKEFAAGIARLRVAGGESADIADDLLRTYGPELDPELLSQYGLSVPESGGGGFFGRAARLGKGALSTATDVLDRPSQLGLQALDFATSGDTEGLAGAAADVARLTPGVAVVEAVTKKAGFRALPGYDAEDRISFTNAALVGDAVHDPSQDKFRAKGRWFDLSPSGVADLAGTIVTDPTTYLTAGAKPLAQQGIRVAERELGEEAAGRLARAGFRSLDDAEQATLRSAVRESPEVLAAAPRPNMAERLGEAVGTRERLRGADLQAERVMEQTARSAQGGVRMAGFTLVPGERVSPITTAVKASAPVQALSAATAPVRQFAREAFIPRAAVTARYGDDVSQAVNDVLTAEHGRFATEADDIVERLGSKAKAAGVSAEELETRFLAALDQGGDVAAETAALRAEGRESAAELLEEMDTVRRETADRLVEAGLVRPNEEIGAIRKGAFEDALAKNVDKEMKPLRKMRKEAEAGRKQADRAADELQALGSELSVRTVERRILTNAEAIELDRARRALDDAFRNERGRTGWREVRSQAKTDRVAGTLATKEQLIELVQKARGGPLTEFEAKRLGALTERTRILENLATSRETRLARTESKVRDAMQGRAVKAANEKAEQAVGKAARKRPFLKDVDSYVMRELSPEGRKAIEAEGGPLAAAFSREKSSLTRGLEQGGSLKRRLLLPDKSILEANEELAARLGKDGLKVFETNPIELTAKRAILAKRAEAEVRTVAGLSRITDSAGNPLIVAGKDAAKQARELGYAKIETRHLGDVWAAPEVATEWNRVAAVVYNDQSLAQWQKFVDDWGALWAGYATVPVMFGTGFFSRNAMGNLFNNFLAGVSAGSYRRARKAQVAIHQAIKETGRKAGPEFEAAIFKHLPEREAQLVLEARQLGVTTEGFFSADLSDDVIERLGTAQGLGKKLNPLNRHNVLLEPGAKLNKVIEDNARLSHFLSKADELGDTTAAARSVRKYLFDYGDLTPFERNKLRRVARFYTYMRKNTPLIFSELAHQPGKFTGAEHVRRSLAGDDPGGALPGYGLAGGAVPIAGNLVSVDTPLSSAMETAQPILQLAALTPGLREALPESLRPEEGLEEVTRSALGMSSGGPVELLKFAVETTTNQSLFTGAPLKRGGKETALRFAAALNPSVGKGRSLTKGLTDGETRAKAKLVTAITGLQVIALDERATTGEQYRQLELVDDALDRLKDEGVDVPTITELRDAGIIPKAVMSTSRAPRRSAAQRRADALVALEEKGADTSEAGTYNASGSGRRSSRTR